MSCPSAKGPLPEVGPDDQLCAATFVGLALPLRSGGPEPKTNAMPLAP